MEARPKPFFAFHDAVTRTQIGVESRTTGVLGIDMQDYGANCAIMYDGDHWGWVLRSFSFDVLSSNPDLPAVAEYFRPIRSDRSEDQVFGDFASGISLFWDDDTEIGNEIDEDEALGAFFWGTLRDEELRDNRDNDDDGLIDEDCGDGDPVGLVNGKFDTEDDYIPFFWRNYTFSSISNINSTFATAPRITALQGEPGFRVTFDLILHRYCEQHYCDAPLYAPTSDLVNEEPYGSFYIRVGEWPMVGGTASYSGCVGCGGCVSGYHTTGMGHSLCGRPPGCPGSGCNSRGVSYDHYIEIPDDNLGVLYGDDMYVAIRTNHLVPNGFSFYLRVNSGAITYTKYQSVFDEDLYPGSSEGAVITKPIEVVVDVFNELVDLTLYNQRIERFSTADRIPLPVVGLNMDIWEHSESSPEAYAAEFSREFTGSNQRVACS